MGNQASKISSHDRAVLDMKVQRDKLRQYQRRIQHVLDRETDLARECLKNGDKRRALLALRQKKYQEGLLIRTDEQLMTLETLTSNIEFSLVEKDVMYGLSQGNRILKDIHKEMSLDKVEKILDDTAEAIAYQDEISHLLGQRITNADEEEVLEEFAKIQREMEPKLPSVPESLMTPNIPDHVPQQSSTQNGLDDKWKAGTNRRAQIAE